MLLAVFDYAIGVCHIAHIILCGAQGIANASGHAPGVGVKTVGGRRTSYADQYATLMLNRGAETGVPFNIRTKFEVNQKVDHPKFGPGFVQSVLILAFDVLV